MPDDNTLINILSKVLKSLYPEGTPHWIIILFAIPLGLIVALRIAWVSLSLFNQLTKVWVEEIKPLFYNHEKKHRSQNRRQFADFIEGGIRQLNSLEEWSDHRFTELEAEVEAEGRRKPFSSFSLLNKAGKGLRREKSLSNALKKKSRKTNSS